ncbi:MAG: hypothetical protein JXR31_14355 [Prolixibacteraceae bacterium]|nr:hypothetical protein [Prolixibacteraceae bacterium]MBN2775433.1 hypothetical protein [Prolixibacteraceae bacterium]
MGSYARLVYKTCLNHSPKSLPVYFYGMPDGKVYLIYARIYEIGFDKTGLEFVFAIHEDFSYDYETYKLNYEGFLEVSLTDFIEAVEKPDQNIKIQKVYRNLNSYKEAQNLLDEIAFVKMSDLIAVPS